MSGERDGLFGAIRPGAGDDRHAPSRGFDAQIDEALMLLVVERRRLAGGPNRHQPVRSSLDLPFDQGAERRLVDLAVAERCDQGDDRALEHGKLLGPWGRR